MTGYFIASIASLVTLFLSNLFTIKIITIAITKVSMYINILIFKLPFKMLAPIKVEEITDGNLTKVDIRINLNGFIGNSPPKYTNKSFGVPGIINNIVITNSTFFESLKNLLFSILSSFSFLKNCSTYDLPYFLTKKKIKAVLTKTVPNIKTVPQTVPKHIPASISNGSPGKTTNKICANCNANITKNFPIPILSNFSLNAILPSGVTIPLIVGNKYIINPTNSATDTIVNIIFNIFPFYPNFYLELF